MSTFAEITFNIPIQKSFIYSIPDHLACRVGVRVEAPFRSRRRRGFVVALHDTNPSTHRALPVAKLIDTEPLITPGMIALANWMSSYYICGAGEALATMLPGASRREKETTLVDGFSHFERTIHLSTEQREAVERIAALPKHPLYLSGTTGSGKSEVLLHAATTVIKQGGGVIILSPEISLATQVAHLLKVRGDFQFALLHSRLTSSERLYEWKRLLRGEVRCAVGARSAVFAPVHNLKLILMDEEQDGAYKSSASPRYHARHVAMMRAKWEGASLVMASATPSLESWYHIKNHRITHTELHGRPAGGGAPQVRVVSLVGSRRIISVALQQAMQRALQAHHQIILLLNRRGFGRTLVCRSCGYTKECERCSVPLVYHKQEHRMVCHYCGYHDAMLTVCPQCSSIDIFFVGYGTEMVEQELQQLFPALRSARVDADSVKKRTTLNRVLSDFSAHKLDLLLGTQMIAKGLNFRGVRLVGILLADTSLTLPDFRSQERTYALITQVAGRTGRYSPQGEVIIQSYRPKNSAIVAAATTNTEQFYTQELHIRRELSFPPYQRLIRCVARSTERHHAHEVIDDIAQKLRAIPHAPFGLLGPVECPLSRIATYWRFHLIAHTSSFRQTHRLITPIFTETKRHGVFIEIDIDPLSML